MSDQEFMARTRFMERKLYRIARAILWSDADCADAIQEAVFKGWMKKGSLRQAQYFETWLVRILINECKTIWRRKPWLETELPENMNVASTEEHRLFETLMILPKKQRVTLELHYIEGYKTREIAGMLGIPEGMPPPIPGIPPPMPGIIIPVEEEDAVTGT